jgi:hypothetical protein
MDLRKGYIVASEKKEPIGLTVDGWDFYPHFFFSEREDAEKFLNYLKKMPFYPDNQDLVVCRVTLAIS